MNHVTLDSQNVVLARLQVVFPTLPRSEKDVATYLIDHFQSIGDMTLNIISMETKSSKATVTRLCKRIGYSGFIDLRNSARHVSGSVPIADAPSGSALSQIQELMESVIAKNYSTMQNTLALFSRDYEDAARSIANARCVLMFGNGDAIIPCELLRIKLMKIGKACSVYNDQDLQMFCATTAQPGDVVLAVSHTGRSRSVVESMRIAHERGVKTIAVTATQKSPLLRYCDIVLLAGTVDSSVDGDVISRRIGEQLILETLYQYITLGGSENFQSRARSAALIRRTKLNDADTPSGG